MSKRRNKKYACQEEPVRQNEPVWGKESVCQMVVDPALFGYVKLNGGSFLLACKYSKEAMRNAIANDCFEEGEVEAIGKQIAEYKKLRQQEQYQRQHRFAQYVENIRASIIHKYKDTIEESTDECDDGCADEPTSPQPPSP